MRSAVSCFFITAIIHCLSFSPLLSASTIEVILLGTGDPTPKLNRFGPSTLIKTKDHILLFDSGRGVMQRLYQLNISTTDIDAIFLSHLHSDHIVGLVDLWLTGWVINRREKPLKVYGPKGTNEFIRHLAKAFSYDINIRINEAKRSQQGIHINVVEIENGFEWRDKTTIVKGFLVDHSPVKPAFGFRVDSQNRSVALSGDTKYSEALIQESKGVDVLIHEVAEAPESFKEQNPHLPRLAHHTQAGDAGRVFAKVKPKLAVYSHLVLVAGFPASKLIPLTMKTYDGLVVVGEDMMKITIAETVSITRQNN